MGCAPGVEVESEEFFVTPGSRETQFTIGTDSYCHVMTWLQEVLADKIQSFSCTQYHVLFGQNLVVDTPKGPGDVIQQRVSHKISHAHEISLPRVMKGNVAH